MSDGASARPGRIDRELTPDGNKQSGRSEHPQPDVGRGTKETEKQHETPFHEGFFGLFGSGKRPNPSSSKDVEADTVADKNAGKTPNTAETEPVVSNLPYEIPSSAYEPLEEATALRMRLAAQNEEMTKLQAIVQAMKEEQDGLRAAVVGAELQRKHFEVAQQELAFKSEVLAGKIEEFDSLKISIKEQAANTPPAPPTQGSNFEPTLRSVPPSPAKEIAEIAAALGKEIAQAVKSDKKPGVEAPLARDYTPFNFMKSSNVLNSKEALTKVSKEEGMSAKPAGESKQAVALFFEGIHEAKLLESFTDVTSHHDYLVKRNRLVIKLSGLAFHFVERNGDRGEAEMNVARYLKGSVDYFAVQPSYAKLATVQANMQGHHLKGKVVTAECILELMDTQFAAPTQTAADAEIRQTLEEIKFSNGKAPTEIITEARLVYMRQYGADNDELVERQVRSFITVRLQEEAKSYPILAKFRDKITDMDFGSKSLDDWSKQFRVWEGESDFKDALKSAVKKPSVAGGRSVNMLLGTGFRDFDDSTEDEKGTAMTPNEASLARIAAGLLAPLEVDALHQSGMTTQSFLKRMVAMVKQFEDGELPPAKKMDVAWTQVHGMPGMAAPADGMRPPIHIGNVAQELGIEVSDKCPKDANAYVGFHCLCNHFRKVPEENWYWNEKSEEFKSGKPEYARVKPPDVKLFGYMHKLGKCSIIRAKAHQIVRADPSKIHLLSPLPKELCGDCITPTTTK